MSDCCNLLGSNPLDNGMFGFGKTLCPHIIPSGRMSATFGLGKTNNEFISSDTLGGLPDGEVTLSNPLEHSLLGQLYRQQHL